MSREARHRLLSIRSSAEGCGWGPGFGPFRVFVVIVCLLVTCLHWDPTVSLGFLADWPWPFSFWGSCNSRNCHLCLQAWRTTCASLRAACQLMDFWILLLLPLTSIGHWTLFCVVASASFSSFLWSDPDPQLKSYHQSAGWTFQPHGFAAQNLCYRFREYERVVAQVMRHFAGFWKPPCSCLWVTMSFDATLGYPGEGPTSSLFSLVSANIGSVMSDTTWKTWNADCVCLQETRVGKNNIRSASKLFQTAGFTPCFGQLLPGLWYGDKSTKTPCGGALVAGGTAYTQTFEHQQDASGLFDPLFKTKRFAAAWIQVTPRKKALVISLYATTSASQDVRIHDSNNQLFEDIFSFVAQFGQIPVIIAGDFQAPPMSYPAIANAVCFRSWHDPVAVVDEQGVLSRPLTFSNDGTFAGVGDACTSIDAVLVNDIAFAALHSAEVVQVFGKQHRPIKLVFDCLQSISLGSTLLKLPPSSWRDVKGICTPHLRSPGMINVRLNLISTLTRSPNGML